MQTTFVVHVEDNKETLLRVVSLFHRLALKVDSLVYGATKVAGEAAITISVDTEQVKVERISAQLNKIVDVLLVEVVGSFERHARNRRSCKVQR